MSRFPKFYDFEPLDDNFTCIHPCKIQDSQPSRRCTRLVGGADRAVAAAKRNTIMLFKGSDEEIWRNLMAYVELCCCKRSHRGTARKLGRYHGVATEWLAELVRYTQSTPRTGPLQDEPPRFLPYPSNGEKDSLPFVIAQPLPLRDSEDGTLYMIARREDPGFYKIGYTTQIADVRFAYMEADCDFVPIPVRQIRKVPYIRRVEKLVHAELIQWRRECTTCGNNRKCGALHSEWFEGDRDHALAVMERWVKWATEADPYSVADGALKASWTQAIHKFDASGQLPTSANLLEVLERQQCELGTLVVHFSALKV